MAKILSLLLLCAAFTITGCAMLTAWKSIPPPGGCDQCHTIPISANWQLAYTPPVLSDERNRQYFQTEQHSVTGSGKPESSLELQKVEELKCFDCHRTPTQDHKERRGRFHHKGGTAP